jgi:hypothetical protein
MPQSARRKATLDRVTRVCPRHAAAPRVPA